MGACERWHIEITGTIQGVGFRPFVYRKATELELTGSVRNTPEGVTIEVQGEADRLCTFVDGLRSEPPPLAEIRTLTHRPITPFEEDAFVIATSASGEQELKPAISPDIATCDDCLRELMSSGDRRFRYPFTNCTNCGPRYTIIEGFPYDRAKTSMKNFAMCNACAAEYADPSARRFHAQPNACPDCGPQLNIPLDEALASIAHGNIVAIKGLGGFHLACDATNGQAVERLRARKRRDQKPFAIMVRDLEAARSICHISDDEAQLLTSPRCPIVLLHKKDGIPIADAVAPDNKLLGVMLPYTPLHHLLFTTRRADDIGRQRGASDTPLPKLRRGSVRSQSALALVMTSANFSDEPIISDNNDARTQLADVADAFLTHDRPIHMRTDDSVIRPAKGGTIMIRRARGYVPSPIALPFSGPNVLALGGDIKNVFCLTDGTNAYLSQHIGDLANIESHEHFERTIEHLCSLLKIEPELIACDMHPDYFSSLVARRWALTAGIPPWVVTQGGNTRSAPSSRIKTIDIQHHHAHIASCMAEHALPNQKVIGIALDGAGYGPDGTIWGGEILRADYAGYERLGRLKPVPQPGGDAAAREPWRMAVAYLRKLSALSCQLSAKDILKNIPEQELALVDQALEKDINCPLTSSLGRLFDAVAAILGIASYNAFEGQAAMMLEQAADEAVDESYAMDVRLESSDLIEIDAAPMIRAIVGDVHDGVPTRAISAKFHNAVVNAFLQAVQLIGGDEAVVLSGGCMQNAWLVQGLTKRLEKAGRRVYTHRLVPPNDGGLALGQAVVAAYQCSRALVR